jgi:hypothetical protein
MGGVTITQQIHRLRLFGGRKRFSEQRVDAVFVCGEVEGFIVIVVLGCATEAQAGVAPPTTGTKTQVAADKAAALPGPTEAAGLAWTANQAGIIISPGADQSDKRILELFRRKLVI